MQRSEVRRNHGRIHRLCCRKAVGLLEGIGSRAVCCNAGYAADGTGEDIKNACVQLLTDLGMERKKLTAVATDAAAAMRGSKKDGAKILSD